MKKHYRRFLWILLVLLIVGPALSHFIPAYEPVHGVLVYSTVLAMILYIARRIRVSMFRAKTAKREKELIDF